MEQDKQLYVKGYDGPTTERSADDCANEWRKLGLSNIDSLLLEQLSYALGRSEQKITVLDIGSGTGSSMLKQVVTDPEIVPETRKFLSFHSNMSLELIGLTDASSKENFQIPLVEQQVFIHDMRANLRNISYTLTAAQTLSEFLQAQNATKLHLILATWSLAYVSPRVFREIVATSVSSLESNGRFLGVGYNDAVSGIGFKYHPDRDVVHFAIRSSKLPGNLWEALLEDFPEDSTNPLLKRKQIKRLKRYFRSIINSSAVNVTSSDRQQLGKRVDQATTAKDLQLVANTLKTPIRRLWEHQFADIIGSQKEKTLHDIKNTEGDLFLIIVGPNLFSIQK